MGVLGAGILLVALAAIGSSVALLSSALIESSAVSRRTARARKRVAGAGITGEEATAGRLAVVPDTGVVARIMGSTRWGKRIEQEIVNAGLELGPAEAVRRALWAALAGVFAGLLLTQSIAPGIVLAIGILVAARVWLQGAADKRIERMRAQLPDAFTLVGNSLSSGLSLQQALAYAARETEAPLGPQLFGLVNDVAAGLSLSEALERFRDAVPLRELQTISTAMEIQHRIGGNIREMLEQATSAVRQTLELRMSLRAQTAQGRLSAQVVGLMPIGLLVVVSLMSKDYLAAFFDPNRPVGIFIFVIALFMDLVGYMLVRKIMDVEI